jgi:hypothetical protein
VLLLWVAVLLSAYVPLCAGEAEVKALAAAEFFACGGVGYAGTTSEGEVAFKKIYAEKNNLEQFIVVYGRGTNAARMYALVAFHKLNRPLYDHIKNQYAESRIQVPVMIGCLGDAEGVGALISKLEKGGYDELFPVEAKPAQ